MSLNGELTDLGYRSVRVYTLAMRFPRMVGKGFNGERLPGGPYTVPQFVGGGMTFGLSGISAYYLPLGNPLINLLIGAGLTFLIGGGAGAHSCRRNTNNHPPGLDPGVTGVDDTDYHRAHAHRQPTGHRRRRRHGARTTQAPTTTTAITTGRGDPPPPAGSTEHPRLGASSSPRERHITEAMRRMVSEDDLDLDDYIAECNAQAARLESLRPRRRLYWLSMPLDQNFRHGPAGSRLLPSSILSGGDGQPTVEDIDKAVSKAAELAARLKDIVTLTPVTDRMMRWLWDQHISRGLDAGPCPRPVPAASAPAYAPSPRRCSTKAPTPTALTTPAGGDATPHRSVGSAKSPVPTQTIRAPPTSACSPSSRSRQTT
jgi:hypothetical protein